MDPIGGKEHIRKKVKADFTGSISPGDIRIMSKKVMDRINKQEFFSNSHTLAGYMPLPDEVDIVPLIQTAIERGKTVVLPKCEQRKKMLTLHEVRNLDTDLCIGFAGIREPKNTIPVYSNCIDLILVPGRAFDKRGSRLGRGGGYYDRFLAKNVSAVKVGVAFEFQIMDELEASIHDVQMDFIVTEQRVIGNFNENTNIN